MAATRIIAGTVREVWTEAVPLAGGTARAITTGIRAHNVLRTHALAWLIIGSIVQNPSISAVLSVVNGVYVVTIANGGAGASSATYTLEIMRVNSPQQGRDSGLGIVYVIAAGSTVSSGAGPVPVSSVGRVVLGGNRSSGSDVEKIVFEELVNFDRITTAGTNIEVSLAGIARLQTAPGTGTIKVYVGATTPGSTTGGIVRASALVTLSTEEEISATGAAFANPGGTLLVQVTLENSAAPEFTYFRGYTIGIG